MGHSAVPRLLDRLAETDAAALLELLDRLPDERMYTLLLLRHGFAMSWPAIRSAAERRGMYYCERHLFRLYARALAETAALLEAAHEK
jgi:hypothetical protein